MDNHDDVLVHPDDKEASGDSMVPPVVEEEGDVRGGDNADAHNRPYPQTPIPTIIATAATVPRATTACFRTDDAEEESGADEEERLLRAIDDASPFPNGRSQDCLAKI